eukprot:m.151818 g.151818  ORF g.151818 m.151818 type:complete len:200 (+) comp38582_c0_seq74:229-828(+)
MGTPLKPLAFLLLCLYADAEMDVVDLRVDASGNYSDIYFRRLPRQIDVGSKVKVTLSLGLPRTVFSLLLACNQTHYDFQLDINFRIDQIILSSTSGRRRKRERGPLPQEIKSLRTKHLTVYLNAISNASFVVGVVDDQGDGVETLYDSPFPFCKARYLLLHGSRDIHSIKIGGTWGVSSCNLIGCPQACRHSDGADCEE